MGKAACDDFNSVIIFIRCVTVSGMIPGAYLYE